MLDMTRLRMALSDKRADFDQFDRQAVAVRKRFREAWSLLQRLPSAMIAGRLAVDAAPAARPGPEWDQAGGAIVGGGCAFGSHAEAHDWAAEQLAGVLTMGADASQIEPMPELLLPVALVQVGYFLNPHASGIPYRKDASVHLLSPLDLASDDLEAKSELVCQRFELETGQLADLIRAQAGRTPTPVAFYDGPLAISFADRAPPAARERYLRAIRNLMQASEAARIPVVGYIDSSQSKDLASLTAVFAGLDESESPIDAALIADDLPGWGQRTAACLCLRPGVWQQAGSVGFAYVRTHGGLPSRVEFPWWVHEAGLLPAVMTAVLAECVVGQGYPYPLEVADATAVLSVGDRASFQRALLAFAEAEGIPLLRSHKALSKGRRR